MAIVPATVLLWAAPIVNDIAVDRLIWITFAETLIADVYAKSLP
jgi:hypothetical protein